MEKAVGTRASVHVGCSLQEYAHICLKDTDLPGSAKVVGAGGLSMLASRLSWFYDFTGPSMTLDTACSSGLLAVHLACNDILSGAVDMGVACGANLSLIPGPTTLLSALNMMSPTSICYSFDDRANGYSRSEGFGVVLLKKLSKAIADGDTIRGVIRATGTNQDGRTPGITQPSGTAQERLTRETYAKAGLDMNLTRYFEAHGTGTKIGDPTEASAISNAFSSRTPEEPMYIGALKSNMGHAEATSGIAGLIKSLLVLEHGVIPPNKYPEQLNLVIAANWPQLKFPQEPTPWPVEGTKRISVNSFGYGGSNIHVILDDVVNFLKENGLTAKHNTIVEGETRKPLAIENSDALSAEIGAPNNKLLVISAFDQRAVERLSAAHEDWLHNHDLNDAVISDLAFTLSAHRSRFTWKTFSTASPESIKELSWSTPVRVRHDTKVCFVFTGQGAQYYGMGRELYKYEAFRKSMQNTDAYFKELGAEWSLIDELYTVGAEKSNINRPELSQPICSAIQVAMLDLLTSWNIKCTTVIGHSSGEIAAAYASGAISRKSALMAAYFRGLAVAITRGLANIEGSMAAVLAKPELVEPHMAAHNAEYPEDKAVIACYNSPSNVTISGSKTSVARMIDILEGHGLTSRQLKVDVGYHSHHMNLVGEVYAQLMSPMEVGTELSATFVSTVTEQVLDDTSVLRTSDYWCRNLTGSVRFSQTLAKICGGGATAMADMFVELGPHSTLRSPIKDILAANGRNVMNDYTSVLVRKLPADIAALECAGKLHTVGMPVDLVAVNGGVEDRKLVTTLPPYLFNDKTKYWLEGRTSAANRFRTHVYNEFLGTRVDDWNDCEPRWTNRIILDKATWLKDHIVNGLFIFPAAGFMAMALEATRQIYGEGETPVLGYKMRDVKFPRAVSLSTDPHGTELQIALKTSNTQPNKTTAQTATWDQFTIYVFEHNVWAECCSGHIKVEYKDETQQVSARDEREEFLKSRLSGVKSATEKCSIAIPRDEVYEAFSKSGLPYGPFFNALKDVRWNGNGEAVGAIDIQQWKGLQENYTDEHLIHPSALDTILQTTFPALSIYSRHAHSTTVPTGFRSAWFSSNIANAQPELQTAVHAKVVEKGFRDKLFAISVAKKNLDTLLFAGEMEASTIGGTVSDASGESYKPLYRIQYKPDIDLLPARNLSLEAQSPKDTSLVQDKKMLCLSSMRSALDTPAARQVLAGTDDLAPHIQEYVQWMQAKTATQTETTSESLESLCQRLESVDVESQLLVRVARALPEILAGEVDPLNLLFSDELLNDFHANFKSNQQLLARAAEEVDLMAHKNPQLKVLEIGAGTGTATEHILAALGDRVTEYVYTDVTQSFFLKARGKFSSPKVTFKTLDISQDPIAQGYAKGEFDVIVAANVSSLLIFILPILTLLGSPRDWRYPECAHPVPHSAQAQRSHPPPRDHQLRLPPRALHLRSSARSFPQGQPRVREEPEPSPRRERVGPGSARDWLLWLGHMHQRCWLHHQGGQLWCHDLQGCRSHQEGRAYQHQGCVRPHRRHSGRPCQAIGG
jgi:acyl transferase domain-containing protein